MRRSALAVITAAAGAAGCGSLLGLDSFTDGTTTTTTGAGGTSQQGGGGSGAGTGGDATGGNGGGGGGNLSFDCKPKGSIFDILSPADLNNHALDPGRLVVVREPQAHLVHLAVVDVDDKAIVARTVKDDANHTPGAPVAVPSGVQGTPRIFGGHFKPPNELHVHGVQFDQGVGSEQLGDYVISLQNESVSLPTSFSPADTPTDCEGNGHIDRVATTEVANNMRCAVSCTDNASTYRRLFLCGTGVTASLVESGASNDPLLDPRAYASNGGGQHTIYVGNDFGGQQGLRYGATTTDLQAVHMFSLTNKPAEVSTLFTMLPNKTNDGVVLLAAKLKVPPVLVPAEIYSGDVKAAQFASLSVVPPPSLTLQQTINSPDDIALYSKPIVGDLSLVSAGANPTQDRVLAGYFTRQGKALLLSKEVVKKTGNEVFLQAAAAQFDDLTVLVVWIEQNGSAYSVRGQSMFCSADGT